MAEFVFTSPGVKFRERDLTFVTRNVGITTLGLVGETQKGPAFEPVFVQDKTLFRRKFGRQSIQRFPNGDLQYQLPYVANGYLEESNQLYVTRVLGMSGYNAGTAWAITLDAGVDLSTTGVTTTDTNTNVPFSGNTYLGVTLSATGDTGTFFSGFEKQNSTFEGELHEFTVTIYDPETGEGEVTDEVSTITGKSYTEYEDMVLAVIRSRGRVEDIVDQAPQTTFDATELEIIDNQTDVGTGDLFGEFTLEASENTHGDPDIPSTYEVSLNPNSPDFISNVLGNKPKGKNTKLWVESVYPELIKKLDADGLAYGINTELIEADSDVFSDYRTQFKTPETPWVVSQLRGNEIDRLFRFISISDGDAANREIKISITNIDPIAREFNVMIRDFNDTDANPEVLESYTRCSLIKGTSTFIGNRIGTVDGEYTLRSEYVMLEIAEDIAEDSFPAGFEGYWFNNFESGVTGDDNVEGIPPKIFYKTEHLPDERPQRVFLGISPLGYAAEGITVTGINQNFFNFNGFSEEADPSNFKKTKGFHMDSGVSGKTFEFGEFEGGADTFRGTDTLQPTSAYNELNTRKFTLVPAGGFDGWDVHRNSRSNTDLYRQGGIFDGVPTNQTPRTDFQAWETAIQTYSNPESVTINLFSTPGINWSDHNILVQRTIEMIEEERADSLYIIDSPDIDINQLIGNDRNDVRSAKEVADLLDIANIDSNYSATYFPWIQVRDIDNGINVFIPPTGEVVASIAFTDNSKFPWYAPAGIQRGATGALRSRYRLSQDARDVLYSNRINPMADFADTGTVIFGQKTLQVRESALDRINVRRLLLQIKVLISNIAVRLLFEQNDETTIDQFLSKAIPVLDAIQRERGLEAFDIKMDDSINTPETRERNELYGEISIRPTRSVEYIGITFNITPAGAAFQDI